MNVRSLVSTVLKFLFAGAIIFWLIHTGRLNLSELKKLELIHLAICLAFVFTIVSVNSLRWLLLMKYQGLSVTFMESLRLSLIGCFFNFTLPGGVGGDLVKGYYIVKDNAEKKIKAATSVVVDRVLGFLSMLLMGSVAMVTHWSLVSKSAELRVLGQGVFMVLVLLILFFVFSFSEKLKKKMDVLFEKFPGGAFLKKFHGDVYSYRNMIWVLVVGVALSLVSQSFMVFTFLVVESALGSDLPVAAFFFVVPISTIATALPISPAGIGVGQAVLTFLFSWYFGHQSTMGAMGVTIFQIMLFILGLVGAVIYLKRKSLGAR